MANGGIGRQVVSPDLSAIRVRSHGPPIPLRYVPEGHSTVFDITKRKIHNVLQGVAPKGIEMNDTDKKWFETWIEQNCNISSLYDLYSMLTSEDIDEAFWQNGAIDASVIVIDDPQRESYPSSVRSMVDKLPATALIPIIKKKRPDAKIIFRSHIQSTDLLAPFRYY